MSYAEFFLKSRASVVQLELLEISHPAFTQAYRIVRNAASGVTVTLENDTEETFLYYPCRVTSLGNRMDLDQAFRIDLGDLGEVLPLELDAVADADAFVVKPSVVYRTYRSDDLSQPLFGPLELEVSSFSFKAEGASFVARAPRLNETMTGELYKLDRFPMLRGFL